MVENVVVEDGQTALLRQTPVDSCKPTNFLVLVNYVTRTVDCESIGTIPVICHD